MAPFPQQDPEFHHRNHEDHEDLVEHHHRDLFRDIEASYLNLHHVPQASGIFREIASRQRKRLRRASKVQFFFLFVFFIENKVLYGELREETKDYIDLSHHAAGS